MSAGAAFANICCIACNCSMTISGSHCSLALATFTYWQRTAPVCLRQRQFWLRLTKHVPLRLCTGLSDRAAAARQRLLQHQQAQALSQAPSLSGLVYGSQQQPQSSLGHGPNTGADGDDEQRLPLAVRLKLPADGAADGSLLPMQLLRKYIAYAREHVHPVLSDEAKDILQVSRTRSVCAAYLAWQLHKHAHDFTCPYDLASPHCNAATQNYLCAETSTVGAYSEGFVRIGCLCSRLSARLCAACTACRTSTFPCGLPPVAASAAACPSQQGSWRAWCGWQRRAHVWSCGKLSQLMMHRCASLQLELGSCACTVQDEQHMQLKHGC